MKSLYCLKPCPNKRICRNTRVLKIYLHMLHIECYTADYTVTCVLLLQFFLSWRQWLSCFTGTQSSMPVSSFYMVVALRGWKLYEGQRLFIQFSDHCRNQPPPMMSLTIIQVFTLSILIASATKLTGADISAVSVRIQIGYNEWIYRLPWI